MRRKPCAGRRRSVLLAQRIQAAQYSSFGGSSARRKTCLLQLIAIAHVLLVATSWRGQKVKIGGKTPLTLKLLA